MRDQLVSSSSLRSVCCIPVLLVDPLGLHVTLIGSKRNLTRWSDIRQRLSNLEK